MPPKKAKYDVDVDVDEDHVPAQAPVPPKAKGTRKPSAWNVHVNKVYKARKRKNANYKYSQAMKDAKKTYKAPKK